MKVQIHPKATAEIYGIYGYLCDAFSERLADKKVAQIYKDIYMLGNNPFMGRSVDGNDKNLRQFFSAPNIIIYDINDRALEILHVVDARSDYIQNLRYLFER